jgi:type III restriction enzyme
MRTLWAPGVNNLGTFGRWHFEELTDVFEIEAVVDRLIRNMTTEKLEA